MAASRVEKARKAYLSSADGPVIWGISDCATSAAAAVEAATGLDHWRFLRGKYHDQNSLRQIVNTSVPGLLRRFAVSQGWQKIDKIEGFCLGIVRGTEGHAIVAGFDGRFPRWFGRGGLGAVMLFEPEIIYAWRVC